mmetsp:Transcript_49297/g.111795  ORF Transcript_49297/g.111795 Transcript_49297/m.111795 type:complete len:257 (-) Transcript_49297:197-967(-)
MTLEVVESFFGATVWEHSILVLNKCKKTPEQIWTDAADKQPALETKWRESGTVICTVPPGKEDDEGNLVVESIATQIGLLKQAIVNTSNVYNSDEFRKVRAELNRKAEQALRSFKTDSWRRKMQEENVLLLQGQLSLADWESKKADLLQKDEKAERQRALSLQRERDQAAARATDTARLLQQQLEWQRAEAEERGKREEEQWRRQREMDEAREMQRRRERDEDERRDEMMRRRAEVENFAGGIPFALNRLFGRSPW